MRSHHTGRPYRQKPTGSGVEVERESELAPGDRLPVEQRYTDEAGVAIVKRLVVTVHWVRHDGSFQAVDGSGFRWDFDGSGRCREYWLAGVARVLERASVCSDCDGAACTSCDGSGVRV